MRIRIDIDVKRSTPFFIESPCRLFDKDTIQVDNFIDRRMEGNDV